MNTDNIFFKNREIAAYRLLDVLPIESMKMDEWIVISTSYGGFEIAKIVASALDSKVELMFSDKVYAPNNDECEVAVVTEHEEVLIHEELVKSFEISLDYIYSKSKSIYENDLKRVVNRFRHGTTIANLENKNVFRKYSKSKKC